MFPEDDPTGDEHEWVTFTTELSTVWMVGTPDYGEGEMGVCVQTYLIDEGFDDSVYEAEPIDPLVEEDQLLGTGFSYLYIECRVIGPDETVVIMRHASFDGPGTPMDVPEDEVAAFEDLMNGLVIEEERGN